jgi:hypothetical protein
MLPPPSPVRPEGFSLARLLMVLSSCSPLFLLWAVRGTAFVPDLYLWAFCILMIVAPNAFLWLRVRTAIQLREKRPLVVGAADDHRDHILVYLFAMLLPFYSEDLSSWRDVFSTLLALAFIVFLFWHLNLHYMNLVFAIKHYRVFTIHPAEDGNRISGRASFVLVTRRAALPPGEHISAYRLSDTVYLEIEQ